MSVSSATSSGRSRRRKRSPSMAGGSGTAGVTCPTPTTPARSTASVMAQHLHRLAEGGRPLDHDEAGALVYAQRTSRVVGVDAEHGVVHPALAQRDERPRHDRLREPAAPPRAANEDALEPSPAAGEGLVLRARDGV